MNKMKLTMFTCKCRKIIKESKNKENSKEMREETAEAMIEIFSEYPRQPHQITELKLHYGKK